MDRYHAAQQAVIQAEVDRLASRQALYDADEQRIRTAEALLADLRARVDAGLDEAKRQAVVRALVRKITVRTEGEGRAGSATVLVDYAFDDPSAFVTGSSRTTAKSYTGRLGEGVLHRHSRAPSSALTLGPHGDLPHQRADDQLACRLIQPGVEASAQVGQEGLGREELLLPGLVDRLLIGELVDLRLQGGLFRGDGVELRLGLVQPDGASAQQCEDVGSLAVLGGDHPHQLSTLGRDVNDVAAAIGELHPRLIERLPRIAEEPLAVRPYRLL